jgi:hypothetical protein
MRKGDAMGTIRKSLRRSVATILLAAFSATIARAGAADDRIAALQAKFRCPIFKYLEAIHDYPTPERTDNRFLIIMIAHRVDERYYAQCAYDSGDARMICEIDSPFFNPSMKKYFRGDKLKLVKALGYRLHRKSNYYQYHDAKTPEARYEIAGLLIETIGRVFDMRADEELLYKAPLLFPGSQRIAPLRETCEPRISLH